MVLGAAAMVMMTMLQMAGNQFGFDRAGFRVFVLCPAPRREILLGKNLALAPLPLAWGLVSMLAVQWFYPMRLDHLAALPFLLIAMYLVFCLLANLLSIFAPVPIAAGSFRPSHSRLVPVLLNLVAFFFFPVAFAPLLLPLGVEFAVAELGGVAGLPIALPLSALVCALVGGLYWAALGWQGQVLQLREQLILKVVTSKE
jgi:hypothetical protein